MKIPWKRVLSSCMTLVILLTLYPTPSALAVNLSDATITVDGAGLTYNGKEQRPTVTVTYEGSMLQEGTDYTLSYSKNVNAGPGIVTVSGKGGYSGSQTALFTIQPYTLTAENFADQAVCVKPYGNGTKAEPKIQASVLGETVTASYVSAAYDKKYVGDRKVTVQGLSVAGNFRLAEGFTSLTIDGKIIPAETTLTDGQVETGKSIDLSTLVQNGGKGNHYFEIQGDKLGSSISGTILTAGAEPGRLTILAKIDGYNVNHTEDSLDEYSGVEGYLTVTITGANQEEEPPVTPPVDPPASQKVPQERLIISGSREVTYGKTLQLSLSGGSTDGEVTWSFADIASSGEAVISSSGLLTPVKAGEVWVVATMAGNDTYQDAVADAVPITIHQAPITITVASKTALVGDAVPSLTASDYTVSGLISSDRLAAEPTLAYETAPDMTREGEVAILASGAAVPAGGNYDPNITYVPGKLTIGPTYPITIQEAEGGKVTADVSQAAEGANVTLRIQPQEGFVLETLKVMSGSDVISTSQAGEGVITFCMPDGGVMITPSFVQETPQELPFTDVKEGDWFYDSVAYVFFNGLMKGTSDITFSPNGTTTRGMIVTILYRLAGSPEAAAWSPFQDVDPNQYYAEPIAWAAWNGIVNGKTATSFAPNDPITREQMAAILYRYAKDQGLEVSQSGNLNQFSDQGSISSYAREALAWANGARLITGKGGGILDPQGPAVRSQVAAIFQRFCENFVP